MPILKIGAKPSVHGHGDGNGNGKTAAPLSKEQEAIREAYLKTLMDSSAHDGASSVASRGGLTQSSIISEASSGPFSVTIHRQHRKR